MINARLISEQYGTAFTGSEYEKLQKVYSIWICPSPAKKRKNGIFKYHTVEETVFGASDVKPEHYDLMEVVILNLGDAEKPCDLEILELLNTLFSSTATPEAKKKKLSENFGIAMTTEFESEVQAMCNLSQGLVNYTVDKTMVNNIIALMTNLKKTVQEAMALLNVPEEKRNQYAQAVEEVKKETEQK